MAITSGTLKSSAITAAATSAGVGQAPDQRRLYDFGDRVAELSPEESPFFVYLNKVAKAPTNDPVFRFLENRSRIDWTSRTFLLSANVNGGSAVSAGSSYSFTVDTPVLVLVTISCQTMTNVRLLVLLLKKVLVHLMSGQIVLMTILDTPRFLKLRLS
jgi:hypothetical protein